MSNFIESIIDWIARTFFGLKNGVPVTPTEKEVVQNPTTGAGAATPVVKPAVEPVKSLALYEANQYKWDLYKVVVTDAGISAANVVDLSVSADGKWITVRMADGTEKIIPSQAPPQVTNPEARIYKIKVGNEQFAVIPGKPLVSPTVYDLDGLSNTASGATYNGVTYDSYLDWTKQKYGTVADPLGLQGRIAAEWAQHNRLPSVYAKPIYEVVYERVSPVSVTPVPATSMDKPSTTTNAPSGAYADYNTNYVKPSAPAYQDFWATHKIVQDANGNNITVPR